MDMVASQEEWPGQACRLEALLARDHPRAEDLRSARATVAASAALLPITPEMAWTVPQLVKRIQLVCPGVLSTSGVLRALFRMPERDAQFTQAFADSGFLTCDRAIERARWKYDTQDMLALQQGGSVSEVLDHCRVVLARQRTGQPVAWPAVRAELQTLAAWFPELCTVRHLDQVYARLHVLHVRSVAAVQGWLDWHAGRADAAPACASQEDIHA